MRGLRWWSPPVGNLTTDAKKRTPGPASAAGCLIRARLVRGKYARSMRLAGDDQAALVGDDDQLGPVPGVKLGQDPRHVRLASQRADEQPGGDLGVGQAAGDQREDLQLPRGERVRERELGRRGLIGALLADVGLDQAPGGPR